MFRGVYTKRIQFMCLGIYRVWAGLGFGFLPLGFRGGSEVHDGDN